MSYPKIMRNRYRVGETDNRQHSSYHHEEDWQDFHRPLAALHHRHLHTWGVCAGLEVSGAAGAGEVTVQPGVAIDAEGRMIVLADNGLARTGDGNLVSVPVLLSLRGVTGAHYVTLAYGENEQPEPGDTTGRTRPVNVQQAPLVRLEAAEGFVDNGRALILAFVFIDGEQRLTELLERLRRVVGQTVAEVAFQRPVTVADQVTTTPAGQLRALPAGGLQLTVANPSDPIELQGADGNNFAELRIHAHSTQMQGSLTVQGALAVNATLQVTGATTVNGALAVDTLTSDGFHLHSATGGRPLLRIIAGNQSQDNTIHLLPDGGNVGIGTTQPGYKLDVNGSLNTRDLYVNGAPFTTLLPAPSQWTTLDGGLAFNGGKVGIGTEMPGKALDVAGQGFFRSAPWHGPLSSLAGTVIGFDAANAGGTGFLFAHALNGQATRLWLDGNPLIFAPLSTERMRITGAGDVGIGTTTPAHRLSIIGGPTWTSNGWQGSIELTNGSAIAWRTNNANQRFGFGHTNSGFYIFRTASDPGTKASPAIYDFMINDQGNVGIGTTSPLFNLDVRGATHGWIGSGDSSQSLGGWRLGRWPQYSANEWVYLSKVGSATYQDLAVGALWAGGSLRFGTADDLAEMTPVRTDDNLEPGDVVIIVEPEDDRVLLAKSRQPYDPKVAGVISDPSRAGLIIGGSHPTDCERNELKPIALAGRVLTKVTTENGTIKAGDLLTTAATAGHAMKATAPGWIIGKALQSFAADASDVTDGADYGKIWVYVNLGWCGAGH